MNFSSNVINIDAIKDKIKEYFTSRGIKYSGGSNFDYMVSLLAYNTLLNNQSTTLSDNNRYINQATDDTVVNSLAYDMSYSIRRNLTSKCRFTITFDGVYSENFFDSEYIELESKSGYKFFTTSTNRFVKNDDGKYVSKIVAYNKNSVFENFYGNGGEFQEYTLTNDNITNDNFVITSKIGNTIYTWNLAKEYENTPTANSLIYNIKKNDDGFSLVFGDGTIGQIPQTDEYFTISYYNCDGSDANDEDSFTLKNIRTIKSELNDLSKYSFDNNKSYGYKDIEDATAIAINAPKYFSRFGNNVVLSDFYNLLNLENANVEASSLSKLNISDTPNGEYYMYLVPISILDDSVESDTESLPTDKIVDLVVLDDVKKYYENLVENDLTSTVTNPTYLYSNIYPKIKINDYDNFEYLANKTFDSLSTYFETINGFNKSISNKEINDYIDDSIVDISFDNTYSIVFDKDSITNHKFFRLDSGSIENINCDISDDEFTRSMGIENISAFKQDASMASIKFVDNILDPTETSTYDIVIGNILLRVVLEVSDGRVSIIPDYILKIVYNNIEYDFMNITLVDDKRAVSLVNNITPLTNMLDSIGVVYDIDNLYKYSVDYSKLKFNGTFQDLEIIDMDFLFYNNSIITSKRIKYNSIKKVANIKLKTSTIIEKEDWVDYNLTENTITFKNISNSNEFLVFNVDDDKLTTTDISIIDAKYKKNSIYIDGINGDYNIYVYEYNSDSFIGELNSKNDTIVFYDDVVVYRDFNSNVSEMYTLSDFIDSILEDDTKYYMGIDGISSLKSMDNVYLLNNLNFPLRW